LPKQSGQAKQQNKTALNQPNPPVNERQIVKRFQGLMRDTWIAWVVIFIFGLVLGFVLSPLFFSAIPIGVFSFFYFGLMRYDENGNLKGGG
jgi:Ca2+-dependent lipid-binding protein